MVNKLAGCAAHTFREDCRHAFRFPQSARTTAQPGRCGPPTIATAGGGQIDVFLIAEELIIGGAEQNDTWRVESARQVRETRVSINVRPRVPENAGGLRSRVTPHTIEVQTWD